MSEIRGGRKEHLREDGGDDVDEEVLVGGGADAGNVGESLVDGDLGIGSSEEDGDLGSVSGCTARG